MVVLRRPPKRIYLVKEANSYSKSSMTEQEQESNALRYGRRGLKFCFCPAPSPQKALFKFLFEQFCHRCKIPKLVLALYFSYCGCMACCMWSASPSRSNVIMEMAKAPAGYMQRRWYSAQFARVFSLFHSKKTDHRNTWQQHIATVTSWNGCLAWAGVHFFRMDYRPDSHGADFRTYW